MSSSQPPHHHRLTSRQVAAQAQRRAMNERRQMLTQRIRKKKKSDWVSQKRGITIGNTGNNNHNQHQSFDAAAWKSGSSSNIDLGQSIMNFVVGQQQPKQQHNSSRPNSSTPTPESFHQIQIALQSACLSAVPWTLEEDTIRLEQAKQLVRKLGETLQHFVSTNNLQGTLNTMKTLVQVVSLSACNGSSSSYSSTTKGGSSTTEDNNYYGRRVPTWSELLLEESRITSNLAPLLTLPQTTIISVEHQQLIEQTCWFIGNWTQDFPSCSSQLVRQTYSDSNSNSNNHNNLIRLLVGIMNLVHHHNHQEQSSPSSINTPTIVVIQAAAWAFVNLLKGDVTGSGWDYCCQQQQQQDAGVGGLWNPTLASRLLTLSVPIIQSSSRQLERSCIDISVQAAWILVHLSQREDSVMDGLLVTTTTSENNNNSPDDLVRDILERLFQVCEGAAQQASGGPMSPDRPNYFHHPLIEPCLEVLGHWATGCNGRYVSRLLTPTPPTCRVPQELSLIPILEQLLRWGQQGLLLIPDYQQLLWLCGCLLCDAGIPNHPSTTYAAPSLIGHLTRGLHDNPNALNARVNSLECKRDGVLALWNALHAPPPPSPLPAEGEDDNDDEMSSPPQEDYVPSGEMLLCMLQIILRAGNNDNPNNNNNNSNNRTGYSTIMSLKNLLLCQDVDAMLASLRILDAILRNIPSTRLTFVESDGDQALEAVCDLPLGNDRDGNEAADIAAELIDDFFDNDDEADTNHQFADPVLQPAIAAGGTFVFGLQNTTAAPAPIFLPDLQQGDYSSFSGITAPPPPGGGLAPAPTTISCGDQPGGIGLGRGRGRGRGRGHSLPAWAVQQQQAHR